jgi:Coenzyme PQQ synthesis protein D (PqqD)
MAASYPRRRADVRVRVIEGEIIVLDRQGGVIHQLNPTASWIWEHCDGTATLAEIAQQLATIYEVDPQRAAHDVAAIIDQFERLGLLESGA